MSHEEGEAEAAAGLPQQQRQQEGVDETTPATVVIAGAGIVGLVLALALKKELGITSELYEQAHSFHGDVGAGLGMYPNGLRVIRDISPDLLKEIKKVSKPYKQRKWMRHDGSPVVSADESALCGGDLDIESVGIRRWRLQKVLYDSLLAEGMTVQFQKRTKTVVELDGGNIVQVNFEDGTHRQTQILLACDGGKSTVRTLFADPNVKLEYTGCTCLMGMADTPPPEDGITFMTASTTQCHAVYFPTLENEQCFQLHTPIPVENSDPGNWGNLNTDVGQQECKNIADVLRNVDHWEERFLAPLENVKKAVRVGFCLLKPRLQQWVYGAHRRIVLVGDSAHPPVPYTGQGAQMGCEDAGTLALLMKHFCLKENEDGNTSLDLSKFGKAMDIYQKMRIPRTGQILDYSAHLGNMAQKRAASKKFDIVQAEKMQRQVFYHTTLPVFLPGCEYNYREEVDKVLKERKVRKKHKHHAKTDAAAEGAATAAEGADDNPADLVAEEETFNEERVEY